MTKKRPLLEIFSINSFAAMMLVSLFSKKGFFEEESSFVLISSIAAHEGAAGKAVYAASKGAIEGFSGRVIRVGPEGYSTQRGGPRDCSNRNGRSFF